MSRKLISITKYYLCVQYEDEIMGMSNVGYCCGSLVLWVTALVHVLHVCHFFIVYRFKQKPFLMRNISVFGRQLYRVSSLIIKKNK